MLVKSLEISSFRNLDSAQMNFSDNVNIFYGNNGTGKTNLLEAIFVLLLARSPRGAGDMLMLKESSDFYRLQGEVTVRKRDHTLSVAYQSGVRKKITIDKMPVKTSELFQNFTAVSTAPDDIELLTGPPAKRREFVNVYLSQASQRYIAELADYQKVLSQKNAFLKQERTTDETPYNELLIGYGTSVMLARREFLDNIEVTATAHYGEISAGQKFRLEYKPSVAISGKPDRDCIKKDFRDKLIRYREREQILQTSLVGPHRDEIEFLIKDFPARTHGSQGEIRSAAIALKLAVFDYLKNVRRVAPVLLLDEIFAELDQERTEMLVKLFSGFGQIFLTTASQIPESLADKARKFRIENGAVFPE